jgi:hypothetical protein
MAGNKYTTCSTLAVGCSLYNEPGMTTPAPDGYYSNGIDQFTVVAGQITSVVPCSSPSISGSARYSITSGGTCTASPSTVYLTNTFGTGVGVYTDAGLTTALTGYDFISFEDGEIYNISSTNGVVGIGTGNLC